VPQMSCNEKTRKEGRLCLRKRSLLVLSFYFLCFSLGPLPILSAMLRKKAILVFYGTMSSPDMLRVVQAFEGKYPFIKVQTFRANSERVLNEMRC
jgi:hypothetical protein